MRCKDCPVDKYCELTPEERPDDCCFGDEGDRECCTSPFCETSEECAAYVSRCVYIVEETSRVEGSCSGSPACRCCSP
jgi:hypothetical protein